MYHKKQRATITEMFTENKGIEFSLILLHQRRWSENWETEHLTLMRKINETSKDIWRE